MHQPIEIISWTGEIDALACTLRVSEAELRSITERTKGRLVIKASPANHDALMASVRRKLAAKGEIIANGGDRAASYYEAASTKPKRYGDSAEYLARRIKRDNPEIYQRLKAGECRSVRAAEPGCYARTKGDGYRYGLARRPSARTWEKFPNSGTFN